MPIAQVKPAALLQEREASAKRIQADSRKSLMSSSSQEPSAPEKPAALFSFGNEEPGNQFKSSVFRNVGEDLFLKAINGELQQQASARRFELHDAQHGYIESRREQVRLQEELSMKEKVLRNTQIRNMRDMGEMKRAQELRVDEVSVQKLREKHETIQKLTSLLQEMQEQMNSMNDSGDFQKSGIKLQWEIVLRFQSACNDSKFSLSESKDSKYRNCNSTNSLIHNHS